MKKAIIYTDHPFLRGDDNAFSADASGQEEIQYKDNGGYEEKRHVEQISAGETKHSSDVNINVDVDSKGPATKTVKAKVC